MTRLLALVAVLGLLACDQGMQRPPSVGLDSPDDELASHLGTLVDRAMDSPDSDVARGELAMAYEINGFTDAAMVTYRQAMQLNPATFDWPYYLALLISKRGGHDEALTLLDTAASIEPSYAPLWMAKGALLTDLGEYGAAIEVYERALTLDGGIPAQSGLAKALIHSGKGEEALGILEPLVKEVPHPLLFRLLGRTYRILGRNDEAETAMLRGSQAGSLDWPDPRKQKLWQYVAGFTGRLNQAQMLLNSGNHKQALELLESLRAQDPDHETLLNNLITAYSQTGQQQKSMSLLRHALAVHPDSFSLHLNMAYRYNAMDRTMQALEHLNSALTLSPDLSPAHELRGEILMNTGNRDDALKSLERAHSPRGFYLMAMLAGSREDWSEAIELFRKSIALNPADGKTWLYLGRSLGEKGQFDEARSALFRANELGVSPDGFFAALQRLTDLERAQL